MVDRKTRMALSLLLIILIIPVKKAQIPDAAARSPGIVSLRLLKKVAPPLSPNAINIKNSPTKIARAIINPIDHVPNVLFGLNLIFI
tara:strand:- start:700 stop:960 length:261 start_codon:yes stop_codon:yes gene_type:complete